MLFDLRDRAILPEARNVEEKQLSLYRKRMPEIEELLIDLAHLKESPKGCFLCGGFFRDVMNDKEPNDMDFYFKSKKHCENFESIIKPRDEIILNVVRNGELSEFYGGPYTLQTIGWAFYETVPSILDTYDFTNCMHGFDFETKEFFTTTDLSHTNLNINATSRKWKSLMRFMKMKGKDSQLTIPKKDMEYLVVQSSFEVITGMNVGGDDYA